MDGDAGRDGGDGQMDAGARDDAGGGDDDAGGGGMDAGDAGGGADDGGGGSDDGGGADDGGMTGDDGGMAGGCVPGPVTIQETCPDFTACGGLLEGEWCYTGVCVEEAELLEIIPDICTATLGSDVMGTIVGRAEFSSGMVTREVRTRITGTVNIVCGLVNCSLVESVANTQLAPFGTASCADAATTGCDCSVTIETMVDETSPYTTTPTGELTVVTGPGQRTYEYCVVESDGTLRARETTPGGGAEPGIQSLAPAP